MDLKTSIEARAGARLHLGLVKTSDKSGFIAAGLLIQNPFAHIVVCALGQESKAGFANREVSLAKKLAETKGEYEVKSVVSLPRHEGFGSGTRRSLCIARAILRLEGRKESINKIAIAMGRGGRSMIGSLLFERGGAAMHCDDSISIFKTPPNWRVVVVKPRVAHDEQKMFGKVENIGIGEIKPLAGFRLKKFKADLSNTLERGLADGKYELFSDGVHLLQKMAASQFGRSQGGAASTLAGRKLLTQLRKKGFKASGQSSWGPTLFTVVEDHGSGDGLMEWLRKSSLIDSVFMTRVSRSGASFNRF